MVDLISNATIIGTATINIGTALSGNLVTGFLIIIGLVLAIGIGFRISLDLLLAIAYPLVVIAILINTGFTVAIAGMILIYFAAIGARYWMLN